MKKEIFNHALWIKIMKMSLTQLVFAISFVSLCYSGDANAQDKLKTTISISLEDKSIKTILTKLEKEADVKFIYSSEVIQVERITSIKAKNQSLAVVLDAFLSPLNVSFRGIEDGIVLSLKDVDPDAKRAKMDVVIAADQTIKGTITDEKGEKLPGVSIVIKGTTRGTTTNSNGEYSISVLDDKAVLVFSFIGYESQEVLIGNKANINLTLKVDNKALEEVVVIGYGTQKRVNVIGSVSQVGAKSLENRPIPSLSNALTGQMAGVTVTQSSGRPGANQGTIRVRGVGSFGALPDALILVDGIPSSLDEVNMNDVESVSVLKDASSAAIYGARAANGVILVTTKSAKDEKVSISFNQYFGVSDATTLPDLVNSWEYAGMFNIANNTISFSAADIEKFRSQSDPDNFPNTDFINSTFSRSGQQKGTNLAISGGPKANKFLFSFGYLSDQGLVAHTDYNRYNVRANLETKVSDKLTLTNRISASFENSNAPTPVASKNGELETITYSATRFPSTFLGRASNGDYGLGPDASGTSVAWIDSKGYNRNPISKTGINSRLDWKPINGLMLSGIGGYNFNLIERNIFQASQVLNSTISNRLSTLNQSSNKLTYKTMQFLAEYGKTIKEHDFKVLGGYSFETQQIETFNGFRQDFPSNDYTVISMGSTFNQQVGGDDVQWAIQSLFSRFSYNFKQKYLFESTVRYDGSSRFPTAQKYAFFPSAALGWRVTEEEFFKTALPWVYNLKLKASIGALGNQNIGNYPYQTTLAAGRDYPFGGNQAIGAAYNTYRDPEIQWESTLTRDIGVESDFFNGKLTLNATYFDRYTSGVLYSPSSSVSSVLGLNISETNSGEVLNKGWEFELGHQNKIKNFTYGVRGNFSIINNEVKTLGLGNVTQPNGLVGNGSNLFIGFPMQMFYGYQSDGVFTSTADVQEWANQSRVTPSAKPGDIRYKDISGPNGVPDGIVDPNYDRTYLGSTIPKYTYSMNLTSGFKGFDIGLLLQGVAGVQGTLSQSAGFAFFNLGSIQRWQMEGRFDPSNPVRYPEYPRLEILPNNVSPNTQISDFWVINASYLRVKNLQLGYRLPEKFLKSVKIKQLRLYANAENIFTTSQYREGWDPELNSDGRFYPIVGTFTMGLNLNF
jgi:TonB-linked SusC/RagA family outer membrane protein